MYPEEIPADELWNYLLDQPDELMGRYFVFWRYDLMAKTPEEHLPELLEALGVRFPGLRPALSAQCLDDLPLVLLARILERVGDGTPVARLHDWLRIGTAAGLESPYSAESVRTIRAFVERRPDLHKSLWLEGLKRCPETDDFPVWARPVVESLYGARLPEDFGRFALDRAVELADARPHLAEWLLRQAIDRSEEEEITFEELNDRTRWSGDLQGRLPDLLQTPLPRGYLAMKRDRQGFTAERRRREAEWGDRVRVETEALQTNRASPAVLHRLARAYLRTLREYVSGPGGGTWFSDTTLAEAALRGCAAFLTAPMSLRWRRSCGCARNPSFTTSRCRFSPASK